MLEEQQTTLGVLSDMAQAARAQKKTMAVRAPALAGLHAAGAGGLLLLGGARVRAAARARRPLRGAHAPSSPGGGFEAFNSLLQSRRCTLTTSTRRWRRSRTSATR